MSIWINQGASNESLSRTTGIITGWPLTVMVWINLSGITNNRTVFDFGTASDYYATYMTSTPQWAIYAGASSAFGGTPATDTWQHLCMVIDNGTAEGRLHVDGSLVATCTAISLSLTSNTFMNDHFSGGVGTAGRVFALKAWSAVLTVPEIQQEALTWRPQRFANLNEWWPFFDTGFLEDYSGFGNAWTLTGTLDSFENAPVSWGAFGGLPQQASAGAPVSPYYYRWRQRVA